RRQVDVEAANRAWIAIAVVDDDDFAAAGIAADTPQQLPVGPDHRDDFAAIGADHDRARLAADDFAADVARTEAEAIHLVMTDEDLATRITDDQTAGLHDDGASAFLHFAALGAEVVHAARPLRSRVGRDRRQRRRRCRYRRKRSRHGRR